MRLTASKEAEHIAGMAVEAAENFKRLNTWLQPYGEYLVEFEDGGSITVIGKNPIPGTPRNDRFFGITDISDEGGHRVRVNDGILEGPDVSGIDSDPPNIAKYLADIPVPGGDFTVSDGWKVWVKITADDTISTHTYTNETSTDPVTELLTVSTVIKGRTWAAISGEVGAGASVPAGSDTESYRLLADISITDGVMRIEQRRDGVICVPAVTGVYGADMDAVGITDDIDICKDGNAVTERFLAKEVD